MKKLTVLLLVALMLVGVLTGCKQEEKKAVAKKEKVKIEFWYGLGGKLGDLMKKRIQDFNASQQEVEVVGVAQGSYTETLQKLQAAYAAKKVPAAVLLNAEGIATLGNKQLLADLSTYVDEPNFNKEDFIASFMKQGNFNDKQVAIPAYGTTQVMYYRKDLFAKAGIDADAALSTWESLREAANKMKKANFYGWEPMWGADNLVDATLSKGGKILSEDGKTVLINSQEWIDTWEFFREAIHEEKSFAIHHGGQGWEYWYKTIDDVMQGRAAGYTGSSGDQGDLDFTKVAAHVQPGWKGSDAKPIAQSLMMAIPSLAKKAEQEAAFKWMSYFSNTTNTADWSMKTGYISVRQSAKQDEAYKEFAEKNPQILVPLQQAQMASPAFIDPTGGKIVDALRKAADKVEIENVSAKDALNEAAKEAQQALQQVKGE